MVTVHRDAEGRTGSGVYGVSGAVDGVGDNCCLEQTRVFWPDFFVMGRGRGTKRDQRWGS